MEDDLRRWLDARDARYEVLDGAVLVSPPDRLAHARRVPLVAAALLAAAPPGTEVLGPSYAVHYSPGSFVLPDVVVARTQDCSVDGLHIPPLLVVEVLSPSTRRRDRGEKRDIYAAFGVPHYWLVDADERRATVLRLAGDRYEHVLEAVGELVVEDPFAPSSRCSPVASSGVTGRARPARGPLAAT